MEPKEERNDSNCVSIDFCPKRLVTECTDDGDGIRQCYQYAEKICHSFRLRRRQGKGIKVSASYYRCKGVRCRGSFTESSAIEKEKRIIKFSDIYCDFFVQLKEFYANREEVDLFIQ